MTPTDTLTTDTTRSAGRDDRVPRVAVVGGGLAGLAAAHAIRRDARRDGRPIDLTVYEASDRPGGMLGTTSEDGFVVEWGANAFRSGAGPCADLIEDLGLTDRVVQADRSANRRHIFHGGRLHLLPNDPISLLEFAPLTPEGRFRILAEPIHAERVDHEESVHDYAARHIGEEAASVLLGSMVRGVYGGDARRLSVDAAFPVMRSMERDHRSLVVAAIAGMKDRAKVAKTTWSFADGLGVLVEALAGELGDALRTSSPITSLTPTADGGFELGVGSLQRERFDDVVLAVGAETAAPLLEGLAPDAATALHDVPEAPIAMVAMAFEERALREQPDGFGFLVAPGEELPVLGVLIESSVFPSHAPEGYVLLRAIIGGTAMPDLLQREDDEVRAAALDAVDRAWGILAPPARTWMRRQRRGIPQYEMGHLDRVAAAEAALARFPGLYLAGNTYHGIAVGAIVEDAERVAAAVAEGRAALR
jgi:oxygen-dependent protoporphyrinogen oxidase